MKLSKKDLKKQSKSQIIEDNIFLQKQNQELIKRIISLEEKIARLEKTSQNSSKPPSQDQNNPKRNQSLRNKTGQKPGGIKGHRGRTREQVSNPDKIIECMPEDNCEECGGELRKNESKVAEKRQEIEIPKIEPTVTEYQKIEVVCSCGHCNKGKFPSHIKAYLQIGPVMKSYMIYLNTVQLIPFNRLTELSRDIFNFMISQKTIENALDEGAKKGKTVYQSIMGMVKKNKWTGSDETGTKVNGKKWWEWVWQNNQASYYAIEKSRGYQVVKTHFGEDYEGSLCHDCWSAHNNTVAKSGHQQCLPHIQRDLNFLIEKYHSKWAYDLNGFLLSAQKARDKIWSDDFDSKLRQNIILSYQERFSGFLVKSSQQKDILRLQKRVVKHQNEILFFMNDPDIPFHNNASEGAIRMFKVKQKISGGFRSHNGANRHSILLSIIETAKKQKMNLLLAIQSLLNESLVFQGAR